MPTNAQRPASASFRLSLGIMTSSSWIYDMDAIEGAQRKPSLSHLAKCFDLNYSKRLGHRT